MNVNNDRLILESLINKYGKSGVLNAINELKSSTYKSARDKARELGRKKQFSKFDNAYKTAYKKEIREDILDEFGNITTETVFINNKIRLIKLNSDGIGGYSFAYILYDAAGETLFSEGDQFNFDYDQVKEIMEMLGFNSADVILCAIPDIEEYLKGKLSIRNARIFTNELFDIYGLDPKNPSHAAEFDWHDFAEL